VWDCYPQSYVYIYIQMCVCLCVCACVHLTLYHKFTNIWYVNLLSAWYILDVYIYIQCIYIYMYIYIYIHMFNYFQLFFMFILTYFHWSPSDLFAGLLQGPRRSGQARGLSGGVGVGWKMMGKHREKWRTGHFPSFFPTENWGLSVFLTISGGCEWQLTEHIDAF
jgi:hypothetical protein